MRVLVIRLLEVVVLVEVEVGKRLPLRVLVPGRFSTVLMVKFAGKLSIGVEVGDEDSLVVVVMVVEFTSSLMGSMDPWGSPGR